MKLNIKIICPPCTKCANVLRRIERAVEMAHAQDIAEIEHITSLRCLAQYSANVSQCPVIIINDNVEFVQLVPFVENIVKKITQVRMGRDLF